jgi:hypothetical protein
MCRVLGVCVANLVSCKLVLAFSRFWFHCSVISGGAKAPSPPGGVTACCNTGFASCSLSSHRAAPLLLSALAKTSGSFAVTATHQHAASLASAHPAPVPRATWAEL